jgi:hypothetical protein
MPAYSSNPKFKLPEQSISILKKILGTESIYPANLKPRLFLLYKLGKSRPLNFPLPHKKPKLLFSG